jgi:hypothetical protein
MEISWHASRVFCSFKFVLLVKVVCITFDLVIISLKIELILTILIQMETKLVKIDFLKFFWRTKLIPREPKYNYKARR